MAITLTVKIWRASRPASAEGSGVAKALELTDKHCAKAATAMSLAEIAAGVTAAEALSKALKLAQGKMAGDKSKEAAKTSPLMPGWMAECTAFAYELKARKVGLKFAEVFAESKAQVDTQHIEAKSAHQMMIGRGAPPDNKTIMKWMTTIRDVGKMTGKDYVTHLSGVPEVKDVKVTDVAMPAGLKDTQAKLADMTKWCTDMAKAVKRGARESSAAAPDTTVVDKRVKALLAGYQDCEGKMKPLIKQAEALGKASNTLADEVKQQITTKATDNTVFKRIGAQFKQLSADVKQADDLVTKVNITWREGTGQMAKDRAALGEVPGFDIKTHGAVLMQRMESNMLGVRRATLSLGGCRAELERTKRLMSGSNNLRGYL